MKKIAIGVDDFSEIIENGCYYVDKTLFIKEIIDDGSKVILIPRPRRFGKTLNLSMLNYYFQNTVPARKSGETPAPADNARLFSGLKIMEAGAEYTSKLGAYPVISITLKDVKHARWEDCYSALKSVISKLYINHRYLIDAATALSDEEKTVFVSICSKTAEKSELEASLKNLSDYLCRYYGKKVVILIDEYDMPIQAGYVNGYYGEIIEFMRNLLSGALKGNNYLEKSVLTGILRVAKESIFSGLNNLKVSTLLDERYAEYFGFTEEEVEAMAEAFKTESEICGENNRSVELKNWYNGYIFGKTVIYNPWSIINYFDNPDTGARPYWMNTSDNSVIKDLISQSGSDVKMEIEKLIKGETIEKEIDENIVYSEVGRNEKSLWSFFLMCGYLKVIKTRIIEGLTFCELAVPNKEVEIIYKSTITGWFENYIQKNEFDLMLKSLITADIETFEKIFKKFVLASMSYFDVSGNEPEKVYHAFVLGIMLGLSGSYDVKSNRESGYGRYDVTLAPKSKSSHGIIFEFKKIDPGENKTLETACDEALKQIEAKEYKTELKAAGVNKIIEIALAFEGKKVMMKHRTAE